ncbi:MAG: lipopolysaccharide biosynthesis protein [Planctomycetota bacterium]
MSQPSVDIKTPISAEPSAVSMAAGVSGAEQSVDAGATSAVRKLVIQFLGTVGVAFGIVGLQMGQGILLARILGPVGRGEYATAVFFVQMLLYIGLLGGLEVICRHAAEAELETTRLRRAALWLGLTTGAITTTVALVLSFVGLPAEKQYLFPIAALCSLSIAGQQVMLIMTAVDRGRGEFGIYNVRRLIAAASFPLLLLLTHLTVGVSLTSACVLFLIASFVSMSACLFGLPKPFTGPGEPAVKPLLRESRPYAFSMLATDLFERLDLLLILWIAELQEQGYYAAMVPVVYPLTVIPNTLGMFLFNAGADRGKRLSPASFYRIMASSLFVQAACTIVFMLLIGTAVRWLYGEAFAPAVEFAFWLAPVAAIKGVLQGLDSYVKGRGRPLVAVRCRLVAMVLMILMTALLSPSLGPVSVAIAALIGQVVCLIWLSVIVFADVRSLEEDAINE